MSDEIITMLGRYKVAEHIGDTKYSVWMDDFKGGCKFRITETTRITRTSFGTSCKWSSGVEYEKYSPYKYC